MLIRHLILPVPASETGEVRVMLYPSGEVVEREPYPSDITWEHLAGTGIRPLGVPTAQPYWGCNTGGNIIMDKHLENLAADYARDPNQ